MNNKILKSVSSFMATFVLGNTGINMILENNKVFAEDTRMVPAQSLEDTKLPSFGAINTRLLRSAIENRTWNRGQGFILRGGFFEAVGILKWRDRSVFQGGKDIVIHEELRSAINQAFGNVGGYSNETLLGEKFASYLQNAYSEYGYGVYENRYENLTLEDRRLFETLVFEMLQPGNEELRSDIVGIAMNRCNLCPNEAIGVVRQMIMCADNYFIRKDFPRSDFGKFDSISSQILFDVRSEIVNKSSVRATASLDSPFLPEMTRVYRSKISSCMNSYNGNDEGEVIFDGYLKNLTYGDVAQTIASTLSLRDIHNMATKYFLMLSEFMRGSFWNLVCPIRSDFTTFCRLSNSLNDNRISSFESRITSLINTRFYDDNENVDGVRLVSDVRRELDDWISGGVKLSYVEITNDIVALDPFFKSDITFPEFIFCDINSDEGAERISGMPYMVYLYDKNIIS